MPAGITTVVAAGGRPVAPTWLLFVLGIVVVAVSVAGYAGKVRVNGPRWLVSTMALAMGLFFLCAAVARLLGHWRE